MIPEPFELFERWYSQELRITTARIPSACCLSTIGVDGFPNARFLALKDVSAGAFVVTGSLASRKGVELEHSPRVALTFWWPVTERQVRLQGIASRISDQMADDLFSDRSRESQIVSIVSRQGEELTNVQYLINAYDDLEVSHQGQQLKRPTDWGGYSIKPIRIEFLEFNESRFHNRILFEMREGFWDSKRLQP